MSSNLAISAWYIVKVGIAQTLGFSSFCRLPDVGNFYTLSTATRFDAILQVAGMGWRQHKQQYTLTASKQRQVRGRGMWALPQGRAIVEHNACDESVFARSFRCAGLHRRRQGRRGTGAVVVSHAGGMPSGGRGHQEDQVQLPKCESLTVCSNDASLSRRSPCDSPVRPSMSYTYWTHYSPAPPACFLACLQSDGIVVSSSENRMFVLAFDNPQDVTTVVAYLRDVGVIFDKPVSTARRTGALGLSLFFRS